MSDKLTTGPSYGAKPCKEYFPWGKVTDKRSIFAADQAKFNLAYLVVPEIEEQGVLAIPEALADCINNNMDLTTRSWLYKPPLQFLKFWDSLFDNTKDEVPVLSEEMPDGYDRIMRTRAKMIQKRFIERDGNVLPFAATLAKQTEHQPTVDLSQSAQDIPVWVSDILKAQAVQTAQTGEISERLDTLENRLTSSLSALEQRIDSIGMDLERQRSEIIGAFQQQISPTIGAEILELRGLLANLREIGDMRQIRREQTKDARPSSVGLTDIQQVLGFLIEQEFDAISLTDLRRHLLPLDLLPGAVIEEVNERAFDLLGEPALEEDGDEVTVFRGVLAEVLAQWEGGER